MSEISHTPGPWVVNPFNAQVDCEKPSRHGGLLPIAQMLWPTDERSEAETEANARLIAAAPDHALVAAAIVAGIARWEAGELCFGGIRYSEKLDEFGVPSLGDHTRDRLREAVAKARGQ